jgi:hypothetical protein
MSVQIKTIYHAYCSSNIKNQTEKKKSISSKLQWEKSAQIQSTNDYLIQPHVQLSNFHYFYLFG